MLRYRTIVICTLVHNFEEEKTYFLQRRSEWILLLEFAKGCVYTSIIFRGLFKFFSTTTYFHVSYLQIGTLCHQFIDSKTFEIKTSLGNLVHIPFELFVEISQCWHLVLHFKNVVSMWSVFILWFYNMHILSFTQNIWIQRWCLWWAVEIYIRSTHCRIWRPDSFIGIRLSVSKNVVYYTC